MAGAQSVNLGLPAAPLTDNPELYYELLRVYNAIRMIMQSVDNNTGAIPPPTEYWNEVGFTRCTVGNMSKIYIKAAENLSYGNTVGIYNAGGGKGQAKKARNGVLACVGFCSDTNGATAGQYTEIQLYGLFAPFGAGTLVPGAGYYQSGTAGVIGVAGSGTQFVGYALSDKQLFFCPQF